MTTQLRATVVIGRFQPFHKGHLSLIRKAMALAPQTLVLLGSDQTLPTAKNIWTVDERLEMIRPCFNSQELNRMIFMGIPDFDNNDRLWTEHVQKITQKAIGSTDKIGLVGYHKDATSYYLSLFKSWSFIGAEQFCDGLNASDLRRAYFEGQPPNPAYLPDSVVQFLCDFRKNKNYTALKKIALNSNGDQNDLRS
jgi:bifunctional NMN adenylyltransferase/nudix hydrolase